jgi:LysR family glycine cleavage system transcriptional activator
MPRLHEFYTAHPEIDLRINVDNDLVDFDQVDMHAAVRLGRGRWPGVKSVRLMDDWILPVCSRRMLEEIGPVESPRDLKKYDLLFTQSQVWDPWFRAFGESTRDSRKALLNDSISILMAAEQGEAIALSRWSLVARDIGAGRLVRPIDTVIKSEWSHYFVAPPHYFDLPKVAIFRDWLLERCLGFDTPV